ncbi:cyclic nucleotide-gated olfactory channel-like [Octopus vulgaris]|uniref:Cyclic nucleotide-gated olfactory channel-like n=1 Tax=Octopus vulgaris TaxID=6645 RepID=A0AA36FKN8_OCTVU|nr:cyclic nucleotide-gated olfactory channel-like [Octopus vulgaris]
MDDKPKEGSNAGPFTDRAAGKPSEESSEKEPDIDAAKLEKISRLLARKRANAVAAAAAATAAAQGTPSGDNEASSNAAEPAGGTLSHWSKLRTTVQIASAVKQRSKRRYNHHRQDSFLRKFSTRNNSNIDMESDSEDEGLALQVERKEEEKRNHHYVLSPEGTFMMYWLFMLTLAVLYNLWTCIAREAFQEIQLQHIALWTSLDVICDVIYLTDIVVQFRTGYLEQGLLVYDSKKLSKNYYSSSDFRMDVACLAPLDFLQFAIGWHPILRFPRFLKVYRSLRCSHMLESRTPYPNLFRVANLTHILFLGAHWFAAFFYLISEAENFVGDWTYPQPVGEYSSVTRKYLYSLFWSTLTLTTIGDLPPPTTNWE